MKFYVVKSEVFEILKYKYSENVVTTYSHFQDWT